MPDTREKLIELIGVVQDNGQRTHYTEDSICVSYPRNEEIADHLIANGVHLEEKQATSEESKQFASDNNVGGKWIPGEQLPEEPGYYLCNVLSEGGYCGQGLRVVYYYGDGRRDWLVGRTDVVTHWMPLPEPPKEVNNG